MVLLCEDIGISTTIPFPARAALIRTPSPSCHFTPQSQPWSLSPSPLLLWSLLCVALPGKSHHDSLSGLPGIKGLKTNPSPQQTCQRRLQRGSNTPPIPSQPNPTQAGRESLTDARPVKPSQGREPGFPDSPSVSVSYLASPELSYSQSGRPSSEINSLQAALHSPVMDGKGHLVARARNSLLLTWELGVFSCLKPFPCCPLSPHLRKRRLGFEPSRAAPLPFLLGDLQLLLQPSVYLLERKKMKHENLKVHLKDWSLSLSAPIFHSTLH